jgi:hypothetical protein
MPTDPGSAPDPQGADGPVRLLENLPAVVREKRQREGLSHEALGELIGVAYGDLCRFELGKKDPRLSTVVKLVRWASGGGPDEPGKVRVNACQTHATTPEARAALDAIVDAVVEMDRGAPDEPTDDDLTELRRLHEAATPGPWRTDLTETGCVDIESTQPVRLLGFLYAPSDTGNENAEADADLIVAMRNALPGLLAEALRAALDAAGIAQPAAPLWTGDIETLAYALEDPALLGDIPPGTVVEVRAT